jgi:hypothetical protein
MTTSGLSRANTRVKRFIAILVTVSADLQNATEGASGPTDRIEMARLIGREPFGDSIRYAVLVASLNFNGDTNQKRRTSYGATKSSISWMVKSFLLTSAACSGVVRSLSCWQADYERNASGKRGSYAARTLDTLTMRPPFFMSGRNF